jgi:pimeloyl-ACP methyl ester carboxylesterase
MAASTSRAILIAYLTVGFGWSAFASPERPLVFVPGILGSQLYDHNAPIWGADVVDSLTNLGRLKLVGAPQDAAKQSGLSSCLLQQYHTFSKYWSTNVYKKFVSYLQDRLGYSEGKNLFIFCYDWRRSNFDSGRSLADFINNNVVLSSGRFDIIAHSMGGLVTRVAMQNYPDVSGRVDNLIELGVPHRGSINILAPLVDGWGWLPRKLAGGLEAIREVGFSFQSLYELLPYYVNCCGAGYDPPHTPHLDFHNFDDWRNHLRWLYPTNQDLPSFEDQVVKPALLRAAALKKVMESRLPDNIRLHVVAGRWRRTRETVYLLADQPKILYNVTDGLGDGTVHLESAKASSTDAPYISAAEHQTLYDDRYVLQLIREILEGGGIPAIAGPEPPTWFGEKVEGIEMEIEPAVVEAKEQTTVSLVIKLSPGTHLGGRVPSAGVEVIGPDGSRSLSSLGVEQESSDKIAFKTLISEIREAGAYTVRADVVGLGGVGVLEKSFVVLK